MWEWYLARLEELLHYPCIGVYIYVKVLKTLYFPDHLIDLVHIWYYDKYSSKVLFSSTLAHYLKVKVMDFFNVKVF